MAIVICIIMISRRNTGFLLFSRSCAAARFFPFFLNQLSAYCLWPFFADWFGELFIFQLLKVLVQPIEFSSTPLFWSKFLQFVPLGVFLPFFFFYSLLLVLLSLVMLGIGIQRFVWSQVRCPLFKAAGFVEKEKVKNSFVSTYALHPRCRKKLVFSVLSFK